MAVKLGLYESVMKIELLLTKYSLCTEQQAILSGTINEMKTSYEELRLEPVLQYIRHNHEKIGFIMSSIRSEAESSERS